MAERWDAEGPGNLHPNARESGSIANTSDFPCEDTLKWRSFKSDSLGRVEGANDQVQYEEKP